MLLSRGLVFAISITMVEWSCYAYAARFRISATTSQNIAKLFNILTVQIGAFDKNICSLFMLTQL